LVLTLVAIVTLTREFNGIVYAQTLTLTPNPVTQGVDVQVTGTGFQQDENAQISLYTYTGSACSSIPVQNLSATTDSNGNLEPVTIATGSLSPGTYCVEGNGFLDPPDTVDLTVNSATGAGVAGVQAPSTPVYFWGLPLALTAIGLVYVVMSRKHRKQI
jgi:hypothetical protein